MTNADGSATISLPDEEGSISPLQVIGKFRSSMMKWVDLGLDSTCFLLDICTYLCTYVRMRECHHRLSWIIYYTILYNTVVYTYCIIQLITLFDLSYTSQLYCSHHLNLHIFIFIFYYFRSWGGACLPLFHKIPLGDSLTVRSYADIPEPDLLDLFGRHKKRTSAFAALKVWTSTLTYLYVLFFSHRVMI